MQCRPGRAGRRQHVPPHATHCPHCVCALFCTPAVGCGHELAAGEAQRAPGLEDLRAWGGVPPHVTQRNSACCLALLGTGPCWQQGRTLCSTSWRGAHCLYRTAPNTCRTACTAVVNGGRSTAAARGVPAVARAPAPAHLLATGALGMMRQRAPTRAGPSHSRARSAFAMFFPCPPPQVAVCSACAPVVSQPLRLVVARLDADCARGRPLRDAGQPPPPAHCHWPTGAAVPISMRAPPPTLCARVTLTASHTIAPVLLPQSSIPSPHHTPHYTSHSSQPHLTLKLSNPSHGRSPLPHLLLRPGVPHRQLQLQGKQHQGAGLRGARSTAEALPTCSSSTSSKGAHGEAGRPRRCPRPGAQAGEPHLRG